MYLSNKKFIDKYLNDIEDIDYVLDILDVISRILRRDSSIFKIKGKINKLESINSDIIKFTNILKKFGKLNIDSISKIINILKIKYPNYTKKFRLNVFKQDCIPIIEQILEKNFGNIELDKKIIDNLGFYIGGEGYYYKRFLQSDIDKMLKI